MDQWQWVLLVMSAVLLDFVAGAAIGYVYHQQVHADVMSIRPNWDWLQAFSERTDCVIREVRTALSNLNGHCACLQDGSEAASSIVMRADESAFRPIIQALERLARDMYAVQSTLHNRALIGTAVGELQEFGADDESNLLTTDREYRFEREPESDFDDGSSTAIAVAPPEVRQEVRHPYTATQRMAYYLPGRVPTHDDFREVECYDLSTGGISFLSDVAPPTEMVVITVGDGADLQYRTARVASINQSCASGKFRIGCEFVGKMHRLLFE